MKLELCPAPFIYPDEHIGCFNDILTAKLSLAFNVRNLVTLHYSKIFDANIGPYNYNKPRGDHRLTAEGLIRLN